MKILAIVAGVVLLIVGAVVFALVAILALPGSSMDADTRLGAAILLVVALSAAVVADVLLILGLRQPSAQRMARPIDQPNPTAPYGHDGGATVHAVGAGADRTPTTEEAPAIVDLLLHRWGPTRAAPAATVLDLAARGHLELVFESSGRLVGRVPNIERQERLAPFEEVLLRKVMGRLAGGSAPAPALLPYPRDQDAVAWYATFRAKVIDEARRMGLVRGHSPLAKVIDEARGMGLVRDHFPGRRLTPAGRAAAARWVVARSTGRSAAARWRPQAGAALSDRSLAWAVALGVATDLRRAVTPPAGPVWSPAGGRWHLVRIPWWPRGRAPRWARAHPERVSGGSTFTGLVIRRWMIDMSTEYGSSALYNVAVDDGAVARAWRLPSDEYAKFATGDTVRVTFDHRGRLVEMVRWPGGAAAAGGSR